MKNEIKILYKKNPQLAHRVAKVLGYRITAKRKEGDARMAYQKTQKEINKKLNTLNGLLTKHAKKLADDPTNWSFIADLQHINSLLTNIINFIKR